MARTPRTGRMTRGTRVRALLVTTLLAAALLVQSACGTLLYPERRGQPAGQIDPAVAILNGIGVLLFIIPGLIAFAVDFSTGAIYLPPDDAEGGEGVMIQLDPDELTPEKLAAVIHEHTGVEVTLTEADLEAMRARQTPRLH